LTGWNPTTGFDEPTVDTIILIETILDPILQMIGRGSRKLPNKDMFTVIDLEIMPPDLVLWASL
jgi:superfamily II DNA or RNA helicase